MEGWTRRTPADWPELKSSPTPVIAQWVDGLGGSLTLYEDGLFDVEGGYPPVELLPFVFEEWSQWLKGKIA